MLDALYDAVRGLPPAVAVIFVGAAPVSELRGAIPLGVVFYKLPVLVASAYAVIGNLLPVPAILWGLEPVSAWMRRWGVMDRFFERLFDRTRARHDRRFERFRDFALVILVAIPLPMTGAWTGALCAFLFGVPPRRALPLVTVGVLLAAAVVAAVVAGGHGFLGIPLP